MTQEIIDAEEFQNALKIIASIREVPNPEYAKAKRDRQAFSPQPGSIRLTTCEVQPSLAEQIQQREQRHSLSVLNKIEEICDCCQEVQDCTFAKEMQACDRCVRVKRNLQYLGVIE